VRFKVFFEGVVRGRGAEIAVSGNNNSSYLAESWPTSSPNSRNAFPRLMRASMKNLSNFIACVKLLTASCSWPSLQTRH